MLVDFFVVVISVFACRIGRMKQFEYFERRD